MASIVAPKPVVFNPDDLLFDLSAKTLDAIKAVLVFGQHASGKTHLMGDFLRECSKEGRIAFLDMPGERGASSAASFNLGKHGYKVKSYSDLRNMITWLREQGDFVGVGLDSLQTMLNIILIELFGLPLRLPDSPSEWNTMHFRIKEVMDDLKETARWVLAVCTSGAETDPEEKIKTGKEKPTVFLAPDLPGKQARAILGNFDLAGYLEVKKIGSRTVREYVVHSPGRILVRQRLPYEIKKPIAIPEGSGGWLAIRTAIEQALQGPVEVDPMEELTPTEEVSTPSTPKPKTVIVPRKR